MDPSSNVSVSFDPSEIEAILNQSAQKTSPLQTVVPQQASQQQPEVAAQLAPQPQVSPFGSLSTLASNALDLGKGVASVLDNTVGGVLPYFAKQATYAGSRAFGQSPEEAEQTSNQAAGYFNQPFGSALGITNDPAYRNEATSQLMDYVGQNIGQGSQWISNQTGLPVQDVENMMNTMLGASGEFAGPAAKAVGTGAKAVAQEAANRAFMGESLMPKQMQGFLPEVQALGIIQGEKSKLWNPESAAKYEASETTDPRQAYLESGTYRWYDNKLRQMLSDKDAKVNFKLGDVNRDDLTLKDVYEHPTVYKAYPHLADVPVKFMTLPERYEGGYLPSTNEILINTNHATPNKIEALLPHEIDHAIQHHEGMQTGTSEKAFPTANEIFIAQHLEDLMSSADINAQKAAAFFEKQYGIKPSAAAIQYANSGQAHIMHSSSPFTRYRHAAGEVEADLSTYLRNKSQEELNKIYPYDVIPDIHTEGKINPSQIIVRRGNDAKGNPIFEPASGKRTPTLQEMRAALAKQQEINLSATDPRAGFKELANQAKADLEKAKANEPRTLEQRMKDQKELEDLKKPSVDEMKAALTLNNPDINWSVKEKGGNWPESWLDRNMERLKKNIPEFDTSKPYTQDQANYIRNRFPGIEDAYAMDFNKTKQHGMHYGKDFWPWMEQNFPNELKELTTKATTDHALNNWVDNRLKPYLRNELATPGDSVRKLADEHGISHIKDLENTHPGPMSKFALEEAREKNKMPLEGHATTPAGRMWEDLADSSVHPMPAKEFIGDYLATSMRHPDLLSAAEKDPNAKINQLGSDFDTRLGLDHLMDELRGSLTGNVPQHLALTPKTLERMTMADAVRHVAKVNDYREKQMAKTAAEDMKDFPHVKKYNDGHKWHELKLPEHQEGVLPEGYKIVQRDEFDTPKYDIEIPRPGKHQAKHLFNHDPMDSHEEALSKGPAQVAYQKLEAALQNEGDMMGHCVGCYTDDVASGHTKIFTLRDKSNKPHATVEMSVVAPRYEDLPSSLKYQLAEDQDKWIKANPTVMLSQFKGKGNKPIIEKYREQSLDLLNNPENVHKIHGITDEGRHDLLGAGIIDLQDTQSVLHHLTPAKIGGWGNSVERFNKILENHPNTNRFISVDDFNKLFENQKPEGHKKGGKIVKMNTGGVTPASDIPPTPEKRNPNTTDYVKPKTVDPGFREIFERVRNTPKPSGGVGYVPGTTNPFNPDSPLNRKRGGHVNIDQMKLELAMRK